MKTGSPERQHQVGAASSQRPMQRPRKHTQSTAPAPHFWDDISVQDQGRRNRTFYQRYMILILEEWGTVVTLACLQNANSKIYQENFLTVLFAPRPKSLKYDPIYVPDG